MGKLVDMIGQKHGRLLVVERAGSTPVRPKQAKWKVICECGRETVVIGKDLRTGATKSCGCLRAEKGVINNLIHGKSNTRTFRIWRRMRERCSNRRCTDWRHYGGRGIRVCERWQDFMTFLNDMGEAPSGATIERIDNNGDYEPANCRWGSRKEQARNKRDNKDITYQGRTQCVAAWAEEIGIKYSVLSSRLRRGWPVERALNRNSQYRSDSVFLTFKGETKTLFEWSQATGIQYSTLQKRIKKSGWSIEDALTKPADPTKRRTVNA